MKLFALSILGLALAVPAARAQNQDTSTNDKATAQQSTDTSKSTAQTGDASKSTAQTGDSSTSTAQTSDTSKTTKMDKTAKSRPAAARSHDTGKSDDECMCDCNGKMIKGKRSHPMGRGGPGMDRSRPSSASDASRASGTESSNAPASDTSTGASTDTSSQQNKSTGDMGQSGSENKTQNPSNPR